MTIPAPEARQHTISLTTSEHALLLAILERALAEVKVEARHTDERAFRQQVLAERYTLERLLSKARQAMMPPSHDHSSDSVAGRGTASA